MAAPKRIKRKRVRGWRMPPDTISVTRPGPYGNPFPIGPFTREESIQFHRSALESLRVNQPELFEEFIAPLRGKDLACWCKEGDACHADTLIEYANR